MFGRGFPLFKVFGFEVRIDASWLLLAILVILSLTGGYFPLHYEGLSSRAYVVMGILGAVGLFLSIIIHELCHSLVARRYGIPMKGITLFMFGGIAQMDEESQTPRAEFLMAIAGPLASFALAAGFYGLHVGGRTIAMPEPVTGVLGYLAFINTILACFNLLPAFPLDGGRVLRSALWAWKDNLRWATRIASEIGSGFGIALIALGILSLLGGQLVGGLWWSLIGMFLRGISQGSYRQVVIRETLAGEPVRRIMCNKPVSVPAEITVDELVNDYVYKYHFKMFPVVKEDRLTGCVNTRHIKEVPRAEWPERHVADIQTGCSDENTMGPDDDAADALRKMNRTDNSRFLVVEAGRLVGVVSLKDMMKFLAVKLELEGEEAETARIQKVLDAQP
jgi:Zn-dependent protease/predicted transcriptional regulator